MEQEETHSPGKRERGETDNNSQESYDGDEFESDSGGEVSEVDIEGEGESKEEGSDAVHHDIFSNTQELDSSITNEYLRQLRYVMSYSFFFLRIQQMGTYTRTCKPAKAQHQCINNNYGANPRPEGLKLHVYNRHLDSAQIKHCSQETDIHV